MNINKLCFVALTTVAVIFASCSKKDNLDEKQNLSGDLAEQMVAVSFSLSAGMDTTLLAGQPASVGAGMTKAAGESPLKAGETVRVVVYRQGSIAPEDFLAQKCYSVEAGTPNTLVPCTVDDNGLISGQDEDLMLLPDQNYDIHIYSPAIAITDNKTVNGIGHGHDFLSAKKNIRLEKFSPVISMPTLEHKCALIDLNVTMDPADPGVLTLLGESITLKNMAKAPSSFTLSGATMTPTAGMEDVKIESFTKLSDVNFTASQIVLPKAAGNFSMEFVVLINGAEYTLNTGDVNIALESNKRYTWNVICKRNGIDFQFSITPWTNEAQDTRVGTPALLQPPANSYMVKPGVGVSFELKHIDGSAISGAGSVTAAELLWQTKDGLELVVGDAKSVIWDPVNKHVRVYTNHKASNGGRAVVVARNAGGEIVYSWLIWVTPYDPAKALDAMNKPADQVITAKVVGGVVHTYDAAGFQGTNGIQSVMMDRNLGATNSSDKGCFFQQGRKDAFAEELLFKADGSPYLQNVVTSSGTEDLAIKNPTTIYSQYVAPAWTSYDAQTTSGNKSNNDPCPTSWRVPYSGSGGGTWTGFAGGFFAASGSNWVYRTGVVDATYPLAGYYAPSTGVYTSNQGRHWGSGRAAGDGYSLSFGGTLNVAQVDPASSALSVRCVQDAIKFPFGVPIMEQVTLTNFTAISALVNCTMSSSSGATITQYGIYYSTDAAAADGVGERILSSDMDPLTGKFTASATGIPAGSTLTPGVTYYAQSFVTTSAGLTVYSTPRVAFHPIATPRVVTVSAIPSTTAAEATLTGNVTYAGGDPNAERGFVYSTTPGFDPLTQGTKIVDQGKGVGLYTMTATGLQPGATYYFVAYVSNTATIKHSIELKCVLKSKPIFKSITATNILAVSANLNIELSNGYDIMTALRFEYSTDADFPEGPTTKVINHPGPFGGQNFTVKPTDLAANTVYYARAFATGIVGAYSGLVRFTTGDLPKVSNLSVDDMTRIDRYGKITPLFKWTIESTGALAITRRGVSYSTTPNFEGSTGHHLEQRGGGTGNYTMSSYQVFEPDITYYVRAFATNAAGTTYGDIVQARLDYIAPDMSGITATVSDRTLGTLLVEFNKLGIKGNATSSSYIIYESTDPSKPHVHNGFLGESLSYQNYQRNPLMVNTEYKVRQYIKDFKGKYYSDGFVLGTTMSNYATIDGGADWGDGVPIDIISDYAEKDEKFWWAAGFLSLTFADVVIADESDGYGKTKKLVETKTQKLRWFPAAAHCWNRGNLPAGSSRWYLESHYRMLHLIEEFDNHPERYGRMFKFKPDGKTNKYWTVNEVTSPDAWVVNSQKSQDKEGKNDPHWVRCVRHRVLPYDLFPPSGDELRK